MKNTVLTFFAIMGFLAPLFAQSKADTVTAVTLTEVVVKAYGQNRRLKEVAAPVSVISRQQLQRFGPASIVPAVNAVPGVRMEERSPGSYRLSIRGSSLRSPFGVRNVKIYWNGIPFTDPGGNTYLNQFSFYNFSSIEILKGPGSSMYAAGTGGVMLINSTDTAAPLLSADYVQGSFQSRNMHIAASTGNATLRNHISYSHQISEGYRQQSALRRDVAIWESVISSSARQLFSAHVLYGDLFYETPGGLTKSQYLANPRAARPAGGGFPSAINNRASIRQKTIWAGLQHQYTFNAQWQNNTSVYGAFSQIRNPAIRNYEKRQEPNFGGRTVFDFTTGIGEAKVKVLAGAEFQQGFSNIRVYRNKQGSPDTLQTDDKVNNRQAGIFAQTEISFPKGWIATAGVSLTTAAVAFNRVSVVPAFVYKTTYNNELAPRVSILKKLGERLSVYGLVSKGFSPPTVAELLPSTSVINTSLQAEQGFNYEVGMKGSFFSNRLSFNVNSFYFRLQDAITRRSDAAGADYFVNAGSTRQQGLESVINYTMQQHPNRFINQVNLWFNHTYFYFHYNGFKQLNTDFSGNRLPGVAPHTVAAGLDVLVHGGFYTNITFFYSDPIALNDANTEYAPPYMLLGFRTGYKRRFGQLRAEIFMNADNVFNQQYSLGNDINAAANRYYNAAPGINYQAGITLQYFHKR